MLYRKELCNFKDPSEANLLTDIVGKSLCNSEWTLQGGLPSSHFFDIDNYSCASIGSLTSLSQYISSKVKLLSEKEGGQFNKLAFIDKQEGGPVGLISLMGSIAQSVNKEAVIVRPKKLLIRSTIKGEISKSDSVLILSDVATTGETIFQAAEKIHAHGGRTPNAIVVIDRMQGATENLGRKGIQLWSIASAKSLNENLGDRIKKKFNRVITPDYNPFLKDFGGVSVTAFA